ncbi:flagellar protein FlaG [Cohnella soli]|uniref:Flagellar protein FlaG n=1 Tax=Cohnella soli TaxID=425005 RepID=A0ABW0HNW9_9BACL
MNISSVSTTTGYGYDQTTASSLSAKEVVPVANSGMSRPDNSRSPETPEERQNKLGAEVKELLQSIQGSDTQVERSVHKETKQIIYKVTNKVTGELIREIPERKLLDMAAKLMKLSGLIVDEKV